MSVTTWCLNQAGSVYEATSWMLCPLTRMILYELSLLETKLAKSKKSTAISGDVKAPIDRVTLYPARQYVVPEEKHALALEAYQARIGNKTA